MTTEDDRINAMERQVDKLNGKVAELTDLVRMQNDLVRQLLVKVRDRRAKDFRWPIADTDD